MALLAATAGLKALRIWYVPLYVLLGAAVWAATLESGIHPTIAGVTMGLLAPVRPLRPEPHEAVIDATADVATVRETIFEVRESSPVADRLQHVIHPWSAFLVLPVFAFPNARIDPSAAAIESAAGSRAVLGIVAELVVGKPLGIVAATWLTHRSGAADHPNGVTYSHVAGAGDDRRHRLHRLVVHHRSRLHRPGPGRRCPPWHCGRRRGGTGGGRHALANRRPPRHLPAVAFGYEIVPTMSGLRQSWG